MEWIVLGVICSFLTQIVVGTWLYGRIHSCLSEKDGRKLIISEVFDACEVATNGLESKFRALDTEWENQYQKWTKLAGRMDKNRGLAQKLEEIKISPEAQAEIDGQTSSVRGRMDAEARRKKLQDWDRRLAK